MEKKERHREDVAFQDYTQDARKIYKRQLRELQPDIEGYEKQKAEAVQKAAARGGLEIVETEDGEVVVVEKSGGSMPRRIVPSLWRISRRRRPWIGW